MANGLSDGLTGKKTGIKKRAKGGPVSAGSPYLVGEEGPELIVPHSSGHVMTAQQTRYLATTAHMARSTASAAASGPSVNFQIENITAVDANAAVDRMVTKHWDAINTHGIYGLAQGVGV
jgi:phage-related minor tail protein